MGPLRQTRPLSPYGAFSNSRAHTGTNPQPSRYLGTAHDPTTKLYDSHARAYDCDYDSEIGQ